MEPFEIARARTYAGTNPGPHADALADYDALAGIPGT